MGFALVYSLAAGGVLILVCWICIFNVCVYSIRSAWGSKNNTTVKASAGSNSEPTTEETQPLTDKANPSESSSQATVATYLSTRKSSRKTKDR